MPATQITAAEFEANILGKDKERAPSPQDSFPCCTFSVLCWAENPREEPKACRFITLTAKDRMVDEVMKWVSDFSEHLIGEKVAHTFAHVSDTMVQGCLVYGAMDTLEAHETQFQVWISALFQFIDVAESTVGEVVAGDPSTGGGKGLKTCFVTLKPTGGKTDIVEAWLRGLDLGRGCTGFTFAKLNGTTLKGCFEFDVSHPFTSVNAEREFKAQANELVHFSTLTRDPECLVSLAEGDSGRVSWGFGRGSLAASSSADSSSATAVAAAGDGDAGEKPTEELKVTV